MCGDADKVWYPQRIVCRPTMERQAAVALYKRLHDKAPYHDGTFEDWSATRSRAYPFHFEDGVEIVVTEVDHTPDDTWLSGTPEPSSEEG